MLSVGTTTHRDHKYDGKASKPVVFLLTVCIGLLKTEEEWWFISLGGEINLRCNRSRNEQSIVCLVYCCILIMRLTYATIFFFNKEY